MILARLNDAWINPEQVSSVHATGLLDFPTRIVMTNGCVYDIAQKTPEVLGKLCNWDVTDGKLETDERYAKIRAHGPRR